MRGPCATRRPRGSHHRRTSCGAVSCGASRRSVPMRSPGPATAFDRHSVLTFFHCALQTCNVTGRDAPVTRAGFGPGREAGERKQQRGAYSRLQVDTKKAKRQLTGTREQTPSNKLWAALHPSPWQRAASSRTAKAQERHVQQQCVRGEQICKASSCSYGSGSRTGDSTA